MSAVFRLLAAFSDAVLGMTENTWVVGCGERARKSPRHAETSQGIVLMSALSAISKCRTEIDWAQGRKSASR